MKTEKKKIAGADAPKSDRQLHKILSEHDESMKRYELERKIYRARTELAKAKLAKEMTRLYACEAELIALKKLHGKA